MYAFDYKSPSSLSEAAEMLQASDDGMLLAGGHTLLPTMKQRLASASDLIDLGGVGELKGISVSDGSVTVGAMTAHAEVAASSEVMDAIPALADLAGGIGDPQVRNRGTIGGSIANNDPSADYPAALVGLNATVNTNARSISADDFFSGMFETALDENEIVTSVSFPIPESAGYCKFPNPASRYAVVGVFVARSGGEVRVAVTGRGTECLPSRRDGVGAGEFIFRLKRRRHQCVRRWIEQRYSCQRGVPGASGDRHGQTSCCQGRRLRLIISHIFQALEYSLDSSA